MLRRAPPRKPICNRQRITAPTVVCGLGLIGASAPQVEPIGSVRVLTGHSEASIFGIADEIAVGQRHSTCPKLMPLAPESGSFEAPV